MCMAVSIKVRDRPDNRHDICIGQEDEGGHRPGAGCIADSVGG